MLNRVYESSKQSLGGSALYIAVSDGEKSLIVSGKGDVYDKFLGVETVIDGVPAKVCRLNHVNAKMIRELFPFAAPSNHKGRPLTVGLGDRLGLASPGHIRLVKDMDVFPVLAQQSIRELNLTGRTYDDVMDAATWAVFQENYRKGWGGDGDHLKTAAEVHMALECGYTMITLDCSEHIRNDVAPMSDAEVSALYARLPADQRAAYEAEYLNKTFAIEPGTEISFTEPELERIVLIYKGAIDHTDRIYNDILAKCGRPVDFEMSIDETLSTTSPAQHFFVAHELVKRGVECVSLAPRFCGEFQKGIDYIGDVDEFRKEFALHAKIAKHFGYKISVHSGSDKFMVFPIIREESAGVYHLKTAGTNWLEGLRVIAKKSPDIFRKISKFALANLSEAKKYYHITENVANIPDIDSIPDAELTKLLDQPDSRQVLHVTYGLILSAKKDGKYVFRDDIYYILEQNEDEYCAALEKHIGRHLS